MAADNVTVRAGMDYGRDTSPYKVQQLIGNFQPSGFPTLHYGPSDTDQAIAPTGDSLSSGGFIRVDYNAPPGTLTSITGYRHADSRDFFSTTADPFNSILQHYRVGADQITEEIHLASPTGHKIDWVAGVFLLNSLREGLKAYGLNVQPDTLAGLAVPPYTALQFTSNDFQHVHARSYALFGEANYALAADWKLTVGARLTREDKAGNSEKNDTSGLSPDLAATYSQDWKSFTPKGTVTYQPNKQLMAYATVASGFKSGGYDTSATTDAGLATPFRPEKVLSYELGAKWSTPEDGLVVNAAAYYAKYTDLQVQEFQNLQYITANAGKANIPGVELEALLNPVEWLTLRGNYSYMNAKYTQYVQGDGAVFTGNQIPFDVKYHFTLGADLHFPALQHGGDFRFGGDVTYQGKKYFEDENNDYAFITDRTRIRGLVNLHANWTSADEHWEVSLWGNNVGNDRYIINATELTAFYANPAEFLATDATGSNPLNRMYVGDWNTPRMFGISVTYRR
jgi:iron complex outermembrane receptor protein